jgi:hypothetical protein
MRYVREWRLLDHGGVSATTTPGCKPADARPQDEEESWMAVKNITVREAHQKQTEGYTYVDVRSV